MNEHTVLCACLLQWVRMEPVSCPESWRSTAPISNRKCIFISPRQSQHKDLKLLKHLKLWAVTRVLLLVTCFPLSLPRMRGCCGTCACRCQDPKMSPPPYCTGSVFQTQHNRHTCQSAQVKASSSQKGGCTVKPQKFQGSQLLCIAAGLVARAKDGLCLLGLLRCNKKWRLAWCRSQACFVLHEADHQGEFLHGK